HHVGCLDGDRKSLGTTTVVGRGQERYVRRTAGSRGESEIPKSEWRLACEVKHRPSTGARHPNRRKLALHQGRRGEPEHTSSERGGEIMLGQRGRGSWQPAEGQVLDSTFSSGAFDFSCPALESRSVENGFQSGGEIRPRDARGLHLHASVGESPNGTPQEV